MTRWLGISLVLAVALVGCGIPLDDRPEVIASEDLPRALRPAETETTTTTSTLPPQLTRKVTIYLVDPADGDPRLVPVERQVADVEQATEIERLTLEQLLAGPTSQEQLEANLTTLVVPSGDEAIEVLDVRHPAEGQIEVVLSEPPAIEGGERVTSFAQIVFTITQFDGADAVRFLVRTEEGVDEPITVKTDTEEGDVDRPVGRDDYSSLRPAGSPG